jgi:hypothetical protein
MMTPEGSGVAAHGLTAPSRRVCGEAEHHGGRRLGCRRLFAFTVPTKHREEKGRGTRDIFSVAHFLQLGLTS